jgi:hypothetical protein
MSEDRLTKRRPRSAEVAMYKLLYIRAGLSAQVQNKAAGINGHGRRKVHSARAFKKRTPFEHTNWCALIDDERKVCCQCHQRSRGDVYCTLAQRSVRFDFI